MKIEENIVVELHNRTKDLFFLEGVVLCAKSFTVLYPDTLSTSLCPFTRCHVHDAAQNIRKSKSMRQYLLHTDSSAS